MTLPFGPPVAPMLAKAAKELPRGPGLSYEPKWDGFRCIVFRDGPETVLTSRNERELTRYFPELVAGLEAHLPPAVVLDGEVVIAGPDGLDFDALLNRIHPAQSRVIRLAAETPASYVAFDLLALGTDDLRRRGFEERRRALEGLFAAPSGSVHLTPATGDPALAAQWFDRFEGAGLDGVVAKHGDEAYAEGRRVMVKVKHERTADCVVGGYRRHKSGEGVGSLLLGLYDQGGVLHHVGVTSSFSLVQRRELVATLAPYAEPSLDAHPWAGPVGDSGQRRPGGESRWNAGRDLSFEALRPELVCEVAYDHLQTGRFRHTAAFRRWRPDRKPASCTYEQLETVVPTELRTVLAASAPARGESAG
ncbi:MAG: ATP-dependent DNA ligase [Acidimicrobiales bacterium]